MRKITPLSKMAVKLLPASLLLAMAMPAHSVWIDQPGVKNGLQFLVWNRVAPQITTTPVNKFSYTYGDPAFYGSLQQMLANQDRQDTDERYRLAGMGSANTQLAARQVLNKDWTAIANLSIRYAPNGTNNWGVPWGIGMQYKRDASFSIGNTYPGIEVSKTDADRLVSNNGTYVTAEYTGISDLTLMAVHSFTSSGDVRVRSESGWHKNNGLSVVYDFNFAPRNKLSVGVAGTRAKGHKQPWWANQALSEDAYMGTLQYQYQNTTVGLDYSKAKEQYKGSSWFGDGKLNKTSYGVKVAHKFTPRLTGSLSYSHFEAEHTTPVTFNNVVARGLNADMGVYLNRSEQHFFEKSKRDRYKAELTYNVWRGLDVIGSVESFKGRNYVSEGEFSKRETATATAGARFTF